MGKSDKVSISKPPSKKVNIKKPTRDGSKFTVKWTTPKDALSNKKKDRFDKIIARWKALTYSGKPKHENRVDEFVEDFDEKHSYTIKKKGKIKYYVLVQDIKGRFDPKFYIKANKAKLKTKTLDSADVHKKESDTSDSYKISRSKYYPKTSTRLLEVWAEVTGANKKSKKSDYKWAVSDGYIFDNPRTPVFSGMSLNMENGTLSATVTSNAGKDDRERYWTKTWITRERSDGKKSTPKKKPSKGSTSLTNKLSYDEVEWNTWPSSDPKYNRWIKVTFHAQDSGFAGDSKEARKSHIFAYPAIATFIEYTSKGKKLGFVKRVVSSNSGHDSLGTTTVKINTHHSKYRPVDTVKWQVLRNQPASLTAAQASAMTDEWEVLAEDDKDTKGLSVSTARLISDPDLYSWIRLVTYHDELHLESQPWRLNAAPYHTVSSSAAGDKCALLYCESTADGTGLKVTVGWDSRRSGSDDDNTGVEISWSPNEDSWQSTEQPSVFNVDWVNKRPADTDQEDKKMRPWKKVSILTIRGLEQSTQYYVKARVYKESDQNGTTYGVYTDKLAGSTDKLVIAPSSTPASATLVAPDFITEGSDFDVYWTYSSEAQQTAWIINNVVTENNVARPGNQDLAKPKSDNDGSGSTRIEWSKIQPYIVNNRLEMILSLSTGGGFVRSNVESVQIVTAPEVKLIDVPQTFTSQPISFQIDSTSSNVELHAVITAEGKFQQAPDREITQPSGDVVWSNVFADRAWDTTNGPYTYITQYSDIDYTTAKAPFVISDGHFTVHTTTSLEQSEQGVYSNDDTSHWSIAPDERGIVRDAAYSVLTYAKIVYTSDETVYYRTSFEVPVQDYFFDEADYTLTVVAVDKTSRMSSEPATATFTTKWAHQPNPAGKGTLAVGFSNENLRGCRIQTVAPEGALETDTCEIYRVTPDGVYQIATNVKFGATVTDRFAPFSKYANLRYLVVTRTADRDWTGVEIPYNITESLMRFDWNGRFVELPYNNKMSDAFAKDVEVRKHLNGSRMASWNQGYDRTANLSTDIIKIAEIEKQEAVRALGEYAGPVFVRTPDGCAYEADVQVNGLDWEYNKPIMPVSFTATEITLSDAFKCDPSKDISQQAEVLPPDEEPEEETGE